MHINLSPTLSVVNLTLAVAVSSLDNNILVGKAAPLLKSISLSYLMIVFILFPHISIRYCMMA